MTTNASGFGEWIGGVVGEVVRVVRKGLQRADPTKDGRYSRLSDYDPFNRNSALRESTLKIDQERLHIFDKWLTPAGRYIAFLEMQGGLRPLPDLVIRALEPYYDSFYLSQVRLATNINTLHGQAVTFGYHIYYPDSIDFFDEMDFLLLIHELEHVSQYKVLGGVQPFLMKYFPQALIAVFNYGRIKRGVNVHDDIYAEREAFAKEAIFDDSYQDLNNLLP
jgi:hypothetical protein